MDRFPEFKDVIWDFENASKEEQDAQLCALEKEFGDKLFTNEVMSVMPTENELPF